MKTKLEFTWLLALALMLAGCATHYTRTGDRSAVVSKPNSQPVRQQVTKTHTSITAAQKVGVKVTADIQQLQTVVAALPTTVESKPQIVASLELVRKDHEQQQQQLEQALLDVETAETKVEVLSGQVDDSEKEKANILSERNTINTERSNLIDAGIKKDGIIASWRSWAIRWACLAIFLLCGVAFYLYAKVSRFTWAV
jgi:hypothetical protein